MLVTDSVRRMEQRIHYFLFPDWKMIVLHLRCHRIINWCTTTCSNDHSILLSILSVKVMHYHTAYTFQIISLISLFQFLTGSSKFEPRISMYLIVLLWEIQTPTFCSLLKSWKRKIVSNYNHVIVPALESGWNKAKWKISVAKMSFSHCVALVSHLQWMLWQYPFPPL